MRAWLDGPMFCNYIEDGEHERSLGTVVAPMSTHPDKWQAFNNTKLNKSKTGALPIGMFGTLEQAPVR